MRTDQPSASFSQAVAHATEVETVDAMGSPLADSMRRKKFKKMMKKAE